MQRRTGQTQPTVQHRLAEIAVSALDGQRAAAQGDMFKKWPLQEIGGILKKKENQTWHVTFQMQVPQCIIMAPPKTRDDSTVKEAFNNEEGDRHDVIQRMRESRGDHFSISLSKAALLQMCLSL